MPIYKRPWFIGAAIIGGIVVLAAAWWLGSPLFIDNTVDEAFPNAATAEIPDELTRDEVEARMAAAAAETVESSEPMPSATTTPEVLSTGTFRDADDAHRGTGSAGVYLLEDGSRILRFEDFEVTNGPDLHVIISPTSDPMSRDDVTAGDYLDLGSLKGNVGDQNYELPDHFDLDDLGSVVIYCQPFHVIFSVAPMSGA